MYRTPLLLTEHSHLKLLDTLTLHAKAAFGIFASCLRAHITEIERKSHGQKDRCDFYLGIFTALT